MPGEQLLALVLQQIHAARDSNAKRDARAADWKESDRGVTRAAARHNARRMPIPKNVTFVTFDVYGTLIDWETGIYEAFAKEAARDDFEIDRDPADPAVPRDLPRNRGWLLRALRRGAAAHRDRDRQTPRVAAGAVALGLPARLGAALEAVQGDQHAAAEARQEIQTRPAVEHRRQAARPDAPAHPDRLRPRRHRPAGALLQARTGPLHRVRAACRRQARLGARRRQPLPRRRAVRQSARAGDLGQPQQGDARLLAEEADRRGAPTSERPPSCSASPSRRASSGRASRLAAPRRDRRHEPALAGALHDRARPAGAERGRRGRAEISSGSRRRAVAGRRGSTTSRRPSRSTRPCCPKSSNCCPRSSSRPAFPRRRDCWPRTPTWTTCSGRSPSPRRRSAAPRAPPRGCAPSPAPRSARCARFDEELLHRASAPLVARRGAATRRARALRDRRCRARAAPGDGHTRRRHGVWIALGAACSSPATTSRRSSCPGLGEGAGMPTPTSRRSSACARSSPVAEHVVPGHGPVLDGERALAVLEEDVAYLLALRERGAEAELPQGAARRRSASCTRRTSRASSRAS